MIRLACASLVFAAACFVQPAPATTPTVTSPAYAGGEADREAAPSSAADGELSGGAVAICNGGQSCNWECPEGGCDFTCAGGSTCNVDCEGGGCNLTCADGASCNFDCQGGGCNHACADGASCNLD